MKKIYLKSLLATLLLLCSSVSSAQSFESNGISYSILSLSDRTVEVAHNANYQGFIIIPSTADYSGISFKVTGIGNRAFSGTKVTEMLISEGVTHIGDSAFYFSSLKEIIIPNSVTSMGAYVFYGCTGLTSITIPNNVTSIEDYAFHYCTGLASIEIPDSVTTIGQYAFYNCVGLTSVTIPNSVTSIGYSAFYNCAGLTSVTIGSGVTSIGTSAFSNCNKLTAVHITDLAAWCNIDFYNYKNVNSNPLYYARNLYLNGEKVTNLVIPIGVKKIKSYAFYNCTGLTSVTIPNSVTSIGENAFCNSLDAVHITDIVAWCNIDFNSYDSNPLYYARNLYLNGELLRDLVIPNGVKEIKNYAFSYYYGLTSVTIPNSVTSIGDYAFGECKYINAVHITDLAAWCNIYFESYYTNPLYYARNLYLNGELLTDLVIPNGIKEIKSYAFSYCQGLKSVTIPNSVTTIGNNAFYDCHYLTSVTIPNSVTEIGYYAFYGWTGLTSVTIPNSVTSIGQSAFYECTGLTSVTIPNSVTSIGRDAFSWCSNLTEIYVKATTPPTIYYDTFYDCYSATLYVPIGTKAAYQAADYWKNFTNIVEMDFAIKGDITGDESVDVSDLTTLVGMILDSSLSTDAADINNDGAVDVSDLTTIVNIILNPDAGDDNNDTPTTDSRAIDLGLSVKWASCNVGATAPEEYGGYYAWGETEEKSNYSWGTYKYCNGSSTSITKYCTSSSYGIVDNKTTLEPTADVATVKWGSNWRMPTAAEIDELTDKCTWKWTTLNGVNGWRVTGPNGNSIFLPAAGYRYGAEVGNQGSNGYYLSSSLNSSDSDDANCLVFYSIYYDRVRGNRDYGRTVRPVCP